ncbi:hypothetical protein ACEZDB_35980 [Streptacidiphilus sp. N1-3]|uniref:Helix-turn-helix domain-containing protein n=1 Tax=Streptacidiphilus alkalitolerans TaxID=3342712 RepID=A0ABV6XCN1_9ACTN
MLELLAHPGLVGADDSVRLAVLVLAAKTPALVTAEDTGEVEIRAGELGRWLGLSASRTLHAVLPAMRCSSVVATRVTEGTGGEFTGLSCTVLPLLAAQGTSSPLGLTRAELATLLRLLEALFAPGWTHAHKAPTPAGLLGARTGRGAATDRLALLLLVLETTDRGRVRLCGGRVDQGHGRPVVTMARLLGCSPRSARRVLERLEEGGVVERVRRQTVSGMLHRSRLVVPAVAAAHGLATVVAPVVTAQVEALNSGSPEFPDPPVTAGDSVTEEEWESLLARGPDEAPEPEIVDPPVAAPLHTDHPLGVAVGGVVELDGGFSGEAEVVARHRRPERECAREEAPAGAGAGAQLHVVGGPVGPLRGEQQISQPSSKNHESAGQGMGRVALPQDLAVALEPVAALWWRLERPGARAKVVLAARGELAVISGITGADADRILADRLVGRLLAQGGPVSVRDPVGWLLGRGLPQRRDCGDRRCDDGRLLTTGESCARCQDNLVASRAMRSAVAAGVDQRLAPEDRQHAVEARMHELAQLAAEEEQIRWERAATAPARWTCLVCEVLGFGVVHETGVCRGCRGDAPREAW